MITLQPGWYVPGEGAIVQLTLRGALEVAALKLKPLELDD